MDRRLERQHLAEAERKVAMGREVVLRQQQIIQRLERDGHRATQAHTLLKTFLEAQAHHEGDLVRLRQELGD